METQIFQLKIWGKMAKKWKKVKNTCLYKWHFLPTHNVLTNTNIYSFDQQRDIISNIMDTRSFTTRGPTVVTIADALYKWRKSPKSCFFRATIHLFFLFSLIYNISIKIGINTSENQWTTINNTTNAESFTMRELSYNHDSQCLKFIPSSLFVQSCSRYEHITTSTATALLLLSYALTNISLTFYIYSTEQYKVLSIEL